MEGTRPITDAVIGGDADLEEIAIAELPQLDGRERVQDVRVEAFYVLEGEVEITIDGRERRAGTGAWVQVPRGARYALAGSSRVLNVRAPGQRSS